MQIWFLVYKVYKFVNIYNWKVNGGCALMYKSGPNRKKRIKTQRERMFRECTLMIFLVCVCVCFYLVILSVSSSAAMHMCIYRSIYTYNKHVCIYSKWPSIKMSSSFHLKTNVQKDQCISNIVKMNMRL